MTPAVHRINPPIVVLTPLGDGLALFLIDYGPCLNSVWVVALDGSRDIIHVASPEIRIGGNAMWNLDDPKPFTERKI